MSQVNAGHYLECDFAVQEFLGHPKEAVFECAIVQV
jgi:hypothetical protein